MGVCVGKSVLVGVADGDGSLVFVGVWLGTTQCTAEGVRVDKSESVGEGVDVLVSSIMVGCWRVGSAGWGLGLQPESRTR